MTYTDDVLGDEPEDREDNGLDRDEKKKPSQATILTELAEAEAELWHDPDGTAWATLPVDEHHEHHRVRSKGFRTWLRRRFYQHEGKSPSSQAVQDAVENMCGIAEFDGHEQHVHLRVAEHDGALYLDLADARWRAVKITTSGWAIVENPPVVFQRRAGMLPLPEPEPGGKLADLRDYVNVAEADWPLVGAWLAAAVTPWGPYPVLNLYGRQGSAKTTTMRALRRLVDPNLAEEREPPRDARDLAIAAAAGHVISYDNLSGLAGWLSDALARLATGGAYATRMLYTDDEEAIFAACRPVIANGIDDVIGKPDLLDRSIVVALVEIAEQDRKTERELWAAYERARPRLLGALLDVVVVGLGRRQQIRPQKLPRMADFAAWVCACAPGLGVSMRDFLRLYEANRSGAQRTAVEASLLGGALLEFMRDKTMWNGTSAELLAELTTDARRRMRGWPASGRAVTTQLERLAPALASHGITATYDRTATRRAWTVEKIGDADERQLRHKRHGHDDEPLPHDVDDATDASLHTQSPLPLAAPTGNGDACPECGERSPPGRSWHAPTCPTLPKRAS